MTRLPAIKVSASFVERRIHKALITDNERRSGHRKGCLGISQIGGCERDLWAAFNEIASEREFEPRTLAIFRLGDTIEDHVVSLLRQAGFDVQDVDPATGRQFAYEAFEGRVRLHLDGKVMLGRSYYERREALLEIKSAKASKYDELIETGRYTAWNPKYGAQIQGYMGFSGLRECLVVVYCKDDSRIYAEIVRFDANGWKDLYEKAQRIVSSEVVPDRPSEATSRYCTFCKWCDRGDWCFGPLAEVTFDA